MICLAKLPDIVLERIVDFVVQTSPHEARCTCAALCLTSRAFTTLAAKQLYRAVDLEYAPNTQSYRAFAETMCSTPDLANYVRTLSLSSSAGWSANHADSKNWAALLQIILASCTRLDTVRFTPDEDAKNHEEEYLAAWSAAASLTSFTLVFRQFRELVLLPSLPLKSLTLELQQGGDMNWDYDILLQSWPSRCTQIDTLRVANISLYAYAEELHLGMLAQVFRAISLPRQLYLVDCCLASRILDAFLVWASPKLEELDFDTLEVVDGADRAAQSYALPELPCLQRFRLRRTDVHIIGRPQPIQDTAT